MRTILLFYFCFIGLFGTMIGQTTSDDMNSILSDINLLQQNYSLKSKTFNLSNKNENDEQITVYYNSKDQILKIKEVNQLGEGFVKQFDYYFRNDTLIFITEKEGEVLDSTVTFNFGEIATKKIADFYFINNRLFQTRLDEGYFHENITAKDYDPFTKEKELLDSYNKVMKVVTSEN